MSAALAVGFRPIATQGTGPYAARGEAVADVPRPCPDGKRRTPALEPGVLRSETMDGPECVDGSDGPGPLPGAKVQLTTRSAFSDSGWATSTARRMLLLAITAAALATAGCGRPGDTPGEKLDKALDKTGEAVKDAGEAIKPR